MLRRCVVGCNSKGRAHAPTVLWPAIVVAMHLGVVYLGQSRPGVGSMVSNDSKSEEAGLCNANVNKPTSSSAHHDAMFSDGVTTQYDV